MDLWSINLPSMKLLLIGETSAIAQALRPILERKYDVNVQSSRKFSESLDYDIVINCAGLSLLNDLAMSHLLNNKVIEVNCNLAVTLLSTFLYPMQQRKFGRIIFLSSVCSEINLKGHGVYSASKAFIDKLVKIAALENAEYGITVNSIQLGYTGIGMSDIPEEMERMRSKPALKRFCTMQELANAINFIVDTEYYTGQNLRLDGFIK